MVLRFATLTLLALGIGGCSPHYRYVTHSGRTPEARLCQMQAQRARDYCLSSTRRCRKDPHSENPRCLECWEEYREAFVTCGGRVDKVCVKNCDRVEDEKLENQTED